MKVTNNQYGQFFLCFAMLCLWCYCADSSIGIEYCQKNNRKVLLIPISTLQMKSIGITRKLLPIVLVAIPILRY